MAFFYIYNYSFQLKTGEGYLISKILRAENE
jgi:hypothetical protein